MHCVIKNVILDRNIEFLNLLLVACDNCVSLSPSWESVTLMSFMKLLVAWVFHWKYIKTIICQVFGGWGGSGDIFLFYNFSSSFVSFFGWRMGYCCLACHLYVLFMCGFYERSHYHIWFIFHCKCPFKSICFGVNFLNCQIAIPTDHFTTKRNTNINNPSKQESINILMYYYIKTCFLF